MHFKHRWWNRPMCIFNQMFRRCQNTSKHKRFKHVNDAYGTETLIDPVYSGSRKTSLLCNLCVRACVRACVRVCVSAHVQVLHTINLGSQFSSDIVFHYKYLNLMLLSSLHAILPWPPGCSLMHLTAELPPSNQ